MTAEASSSLYRQIPSPSEIAVIGECAISVDGFEKLSRKQQQLILDFIRAHRDYLADPHEEEIRNRFLNDLVISVSRNYRIKSIAFSASIKAQNSLRQLARGINDH